MLVAVVLLELASHLAGAPLDAQHAGQHAVGRRPARRRSAIASQMASSPAAILFVVHGALVDARGLGIVMPCSSHSSSSSAAFE